MESTKRILLVGNGGVEEGRAEAIRNAGYMVETSPTRSAALKRLLEETVPYAVILELAANDCEGVELILACKGSVPHFRVIVIAEPLDDRSAVDISSQCAQLPKPAPDTSVLELLARPDPDPVRTVAQAYGLSAREARTLRMIARGMTLKESADVLGVGEHTTRTFKRRVAAKMGLKGERDILARVYEHIWGHVPLPRAAATAGAR